MTEQQIRDAFTPYKHPVWGVVGVYPANGENKDTFTCDDYHMMNSLYMHVLNSWGYGINFGELFSLGAFQSACVKVPGLIARFPSRMNDDISQDEIYGAISVGMTKTPEAYGSQNYYCYYLADPGHFHWDYFFARYPSFVAYVRAAAGKPIWFSQFFWCAGFLASALTSHSETSGKLLSYLQIPVMSKHWIPNQCIKLWKWGMMKHYPGGLQDIMKIYFASQPSHPFIACARGDFE